MSVAGEVPVGEHTCGVRERVPATVQLLDVFQRQAGLAVDGIRIVAGFGRLATLEDDDAVIAKVAALDGIREAHAVKFRTVDGLVVH